VPAWLAFRWLFAQAYNAHQPQGVQASTKRRAGQVAAALVDGMGGSIMAPPPPGLDADPAWQSFLDAALPLDSAQRSSLMSLLVVKRWPHRSAAGICGDDLRDRQRVQLALLLTDMHAQQRANEGGWVIGKGYPRKRT